MLMRKTSAPASNRRRIIALSEEAGPRVARILMRRRRLMACVRARRPAADRTRPAALHPVHWAGLAARFGPAILLAQAILAGAERVVHWNLSTAPSRPAVRPYRPRKSPCGPSPAPRDSLCP